MSRRFAAVFAAAFVVFGVWSSAGLGWTDPSIDPVAGKPRRFDPTAQLAGGGARVLVAGPLACTAKEKADGVRARARIRVTLAQRSAKASGEAASEGGCAKERWQVTVPAARSFKAGPAKACALGTQTKAGVVVDVLIWCQTIKLVSG